MELNLNVLTLNCWGIPVVSKHRKERIKAIADYLAGSSHNIVCFQEIWSETDYLYFKERLKSVLPYSHYFYSGVLGSGLCVFTKWVIQDVFFHQWTLNGYIHKINHGDWFGGKGVGLCRLRCHDKLVNVYCTHLHAEYHVDDIYLAHRVLQAYFTAEFVKLTQNSADICVLAGDLNTEPGDLSYRLIKQIPSLLDPFDMKCKQTNPHVRKATGTCDHQNNSYSDPRQVAMAPEGKRLDHILYTARNEFETTVLNFGNPLEDRVPDQNFSYSDHNAVTLEIQFRTANKKLPQTMYSIEKGCDVTVEEAIKVCKEAKETLSQSRKLYLIVGGLLFMFLLGTVGFIPTSLLYVAIFDITKFVISAICFYCLVMGTVWNKIEINSVKAGLTALENLRTGERS